MMPITISSTNVNLVHLLVTSLREGDAYSTFQNWLFYKPGNFVYKVGLEIDFLVSVLQCLEKREDYYKQSFTEMSSSMKTRSFEMKIGTDINNHLIYLFTIDQKFVMIYLKLARVFVAINF